MSLLIYYCPYHILQTYLTHKRTGIFNQQGFQSRYKGKRKESENKKMKELEAVVEPIRVNCVFGKNIKIRKILIHTHSHVYIHLHTHQLKIKILN